MELNMNFWLPNIYNVNVDTNNIIILKWVLVALKLCKYQGANVRTSSDMCIAIH